MKPKNFLGVFFSPLEFELIVKNLISQRMGLAAPLRLSLLEKAAYMDKIIFSVFSPKSLRSKASTSENVSAFVDVKQDFFYSTLQQNYHSST